MQFEELLKYKTDIADNIVKSFLPKDDTLAKPVVEAMNYSVNAGGKRIRPLIMRETYNMCSGGSGGSIVEPFMAAIEFIHTYSLVHDDLPAMDNDMYRRGMPTTHAKYGEGMGILAGDGLLNYAYETMLAAAGQTGGNAERCIRAAGVIAGKSGICGMVGGQALDVYLTGEHINEEQLRFIFELKTGALIEASFMAGGILAGAPDKTAAMLERAGKLVGVAFQIQDDILDVTGNAEVLGKPVLSDEKNNKTTYVTLYGMEKAKADAAAYSDEAIRLINEAAKTIDTGVNKADWESCVFLGELIRSLTDRKK